MGKRYKVEEIVMKLRKLELSINNGIEFFWFFSKRRFVKFQGIPQLTFYLHLKECEFRFNCRDQNLYVILLKLIKDKPLF